MQASLSGRARAVERIEHVVHTVNRPEYYWITRPLLAFLITRLIVLLAAYLADIALPGMTGQGFYHADPSNIFLDVWARWDSGFYLQIARQGYSFLPGQQSSVAFFPLYPLLTNLLMPIFGELAAGVLVSNLCLFGGLLFLYRLTELEFGDAATAGRTVFYIAAFPTAFFFSAVYTESTFLLFSVATFYFARRRMWGWAALFGLLCSASRIIGVLMWGITMLEWARAQGWTIGTLFRRSAWVNLARGLRSRGYELLIIALIPLGLASYMIFLRRMFGDPIAFSTTQAAWGRVNVGFWVAIAADLGRLLHGNVLTGQIWYHVVLDLGAFFVVLALSVVLWRRLGESYAIYAVLSMLIPASSGTTSLSRYALVIFPVFMLLGRWGRYSVVDKAIIIGFSVFLGVLTSIFVNWIFVA